MRLNESLATRATLYACSQIQEAAKVLHDEHLLYWEATSYQSMWSTTRRATTKKACQKTLTCLMQLDKEEDLMSTN